MRTTFIAVILFTTNITLAQAPGPPFHPMTANGAKHIVSGHKLFWKNPPNVTYNEIYISTDSNLVKNLDPSVKVLSGFDSSIVYDSMSLTPLGTIALHTKYYWRVVEFNAAGFTAGPVWYFISQSSKYSWWNDEFSNGLSSYTITPLPPQGARWEISSSANAGRQPPELTLFDWYGFWGNGYLILNEIFDLSPSINPLGFNYSVDWQSGQFTFGIAYSLDEGITWSPIWQKVVTQDIPATHSGWFQVPHENYVKLSLFYSSSDPNAYGSCYFDDLLLNTPLTVSTPPAQVQARADSISLKIRLNWGSGWAPDPISGYSIQRKNGLPGSLSNYYTIANVGASPLFFEDLSVKLDSIYTYRIQTISGPGFRTASSNEATAYVPSIVPVELISFSSTKIENGIFLNWITASETNNRGFEIERKSDDNIFSLIGFVEGHGTTTEEHSYSFVDKNISHGKYFYRLKQIDFDGTFTYSNEIEVEILSPYKFELEQNYPNPFNPSTRIQYQVSSNSYVSLKVYDVLGNEVATLIDEYKPAGTYEVEFPNVETRHASSLPSGIYFYQLKVGNFLTSKKMILMK